MLNSELVIVLLYDTQQEKKKKIPSCPSRERKFNEKTS